MFAKERHEQILKLMEQHGSVTVNELMERFQVSIETVRKDLLALEKEHLLERVHGGAVALNQMRTFYPLPMRLNHQTDKKSRICNVVAKVVQEHDMIALDAGSTALELAEMLCERFRCLTVVTYSLEVFQRLRRVGFRVLLIGGEYLEREDTFYGPLVTAALNNLRVSKSFLFPTSVSLKHGVGNNVTEAIELQQALMRIADQTFIVADSSKFETVSLMKVCDTSPKQVYITDDSLDHKICELYRMNKIRLYCTPEDVQ